MSNQSAKNIYIKTYGCQMNVYDSDKMYDIMHAHNYHRTDDIKDADLIIFNTCNIREKAADKLYNDIGRAKIHSHNKVKESGSKILLAVAGCVGQAEGEEIFRRAPAVDIVVGPQSYHKLPELVQRTLEGHKRNIDLDFMLEEKFDQIQSLSNSEKLNSQASSFVTIQEGCDKFCHFCVVPYTRGPEFSRPVSDIYREVVILVEKGVKEITLLGQNVNAYHGIGPEGNECNLGQLLFHLAKIKELKRLRYTTSHPRDMHEELYQAHAMIDKLMPFIHLPVQSGSNKILKAMNRKHTIEEYEAIIDRLRKDNPRTQFSSDFIVGYPGETEEDFLATMEIARKLNCSQSYSFKYSPRFGTVAANLEQIHPDIQQARLETLQSLLNRQQTNFNNASVGQVMPLLIEKENAKDNSQMVGRTPYMQICHVDNKNITVGSVVDVRITHSHGRSLTGTIVEEDSSVTTANHIIKQTG